MNLPMNGTYPIQGQHSLLYMSEFFKLLKISLFDHFLNPDIKVGFLTTVAKTKMAGRGCTTNIKKELLLARDIFGQWLISDGRFLNTFGCRHSGSDLNFEVW